MLRRSRLERRTAECGGYVLRAAPLLYLPFRPANVLPLSRGNRTRDRSIDEDEAAVPPAAAAEVRRWGRAPTFPEGFLPS
jgi:hypothetical protein